MNVDKIRENFPHIDDMIYLGAAGSAPFNLVNYNAVMECWNRRRYGSTLGGTDHAWFSEKDPLAREEGAKLVGASPDELCITSRVVQGINIIKDTLGYNEPWNKGDNVVMTDQAYPSTGHTLLSLNRHGVELRVIKHRDGRIMREDMENAVDENTRLVVINRTSVGSGFTYDVKQVCEIAHERGTYVLDDAVQTIGSKVVDLHDDDVDFMVTGSYKWQCGPPEAGFLYVKQSLCEELLPSFWSYINVDKGPGITGFDKFPFGAADHDSVKTYDYPFPKTAQRFEQGTTATDEIWAWHAVLKWLNGLGKENIERRNMRLGLYLSEELEEIGCKVKTPADPEPDALNTHRHALTMYTTGSDELDRKTTAQLRGRPIKQVRGPTMKYQAGYGGVRVSPHFYNTEEEIDLFVAYLKKLMS
ncbi:aminotransferase class V-fold PLP-dependent enzyme [Candidatus Bathyarchaeota archaeon]|nr:aminotransferase class V-fold PLP-dependent enzyme [Candidatus Bathyarchaeota archaeon]MBT4321221.1 aminotransferase class V-fold PLP-dependent enzyme [Candidatus Bathyarchaeota archaeon]MBT4423626.1 aminotransferase class V-fold PLP-dependent enzyme [Candidatus Bathyarchaeota archaeon]MBT6605813.1 aminotransferase class V-fold PLP-dependent enzyme [Candidatus Bathyarchaeota archaeon]MBT7185969.1 aminotransferase class V-fold PLP-dependent enzyme [Candidatus Bathyarchaeota archaeon]